MAKQFVGDYSDEDLAVLSTPYRNRIIRYRAQVGPFGLVKNARGHGTSEGYVGPPEERAIPRESYEGGARKTQARDLYYEWIARTSMVPTTPLYVTTTDPLTGRRKNVALKQGRPIVGPNTPPRTVRRMIGGMQSPLRDNSMSFEQNFEMLWSMALGYNKKFKGQGKPDGRRSLIAQFLNAGTLATQYLNDQHPSGPKTPGGLFREPEESVINEEVTNVDTGRDEGSGDLVEFQDYREDIGPEGEEGELPGRIDIPYEVSFDDEVEGQLWGDYLEYDEDFADEFDAFTQEYAIYFVIWYH